MDTWMLEKLAEGKISDMRREADAWRKARPAEHRTTIRDVLKRFRR